VIKQRRSEGNMKKYYAIVLFIFAFQLMSTAINSEDIFAQSMNELDNSGTTIEQLNSSTYSQMQSDVVVSDGLLDSLFLGAGLILDALKLLVIVFLKTLVIAPTLISYGVPTAFALIFQGMTTVIQTLAILEFKTGRRTS